MGGSVAARTYWAKVYEYACGAVEVSGVRIPVHRRPVDPEPVVIRLGQPLRLPRERTPEVLADNRRRCVQRARSMVRRLCLTMGADRLLTLTFRENVTDEGAAWRAFRRWMRLVHAEGLGFDYVVVGERQKRGAWHFHLAVAGWLGVVKLRALWWAVVGDGQGNIDITRPDLRFDAVERCCRVARYLGKYISKGFEENPRGSHRYRQSGDLSVPCRSFWLEATDWRGLQREVLSFFASAQVPVRGVFFGSDWGCVWGVGWAEVGKQGRKGRKNDP